MAEIVLLGPQATDPKVDYALGLLAIQGPVCAVTAGWQERAGELEALKKHVGTEIIHLELYRRAEEVFESDSGLFALLRERQNLLRELQALYRIRLHCETACVRKLQRRQGNAELLMPERMDAMETVRRLDSQHLERVQKIHQEFAKRWPDRSPVLEKQRKHLKDLVTSCSAVLIAGGHVAVLLNRLRLFDLPSLVREKPIVAWSAGAMILSRRIVLFHDSPPQGPGVPEIFENGLNLIDGIIPLPHARKRLRLDDPERVSWFAQRFQPDRCLALDEGSMLAGDGSVWSKSEQVRHLQETGEVRTLELNA
jgi:hypothetical protein